MNYLLDKKAKKKNILKYSALVLLVLVLLYFRGGVGRGLSVAAHAVFRPLLALGRGAGEKISSLGVYFSSKKSLELENETLKQKLYETAAGISEHQTVLDENIKLKEILGRKNETVQMLLAGILGRPDQSLYDAFIIDAGAEAGVKAGQNVFAFGNIPIGKVAETFAKSSKVVLYSTPGEQTEVVVSGRDVFMQVVGRGGGNFEMVLPRDFALAEGAEVVLPGVTPYVLARVEKIISDPRDAFQKALLISPVNIFEIKFVQVEID